VIGEGISASDCVGIGIAPYSASFGQGESPGDGMKKRLKLILLCWLGAAILAAGAEGLYEGVPHSIEATLLALAGGIAVLVAVHHMITS
jgi:hypothetical protein